MLLWSIRVEHFYDDIFVLKIHVTDRGSQRLAVYEMETYSAILEFLQLGDSHRETQF